ncbi:hypothetical protein GCM10018966_082290 [Streptomyces yanii]
MIRRARRTIARCDSGFPGFPGLTAAPDFFADAPAFFADPLDAFAGPPDVTDSRGGRFAAFVG